VAVGSAGADVFATSFDGAVWAAPDTIVGLSSAWSLSCVGATSCVVAGGDRLATFQNGVWSDAFSAPDGTFAAQVSCTAATTCLIAGGGPAVLLADESWRVLGRVDPQGGLAAVSCPTATRCVAGGGDGEVSVYNGSAWSAPRKVDPGGSIDSISCVSPTFCMAVTMSHIDGGEALIFDGATWSRPDVIFEGYARGVSCASSTFCIALGETYQGDPRWSRWNGSTWTAPKAMTGVQSLDLFTGISCVSTTHCLAVTSSGHAITYSSGTWGGRVQLPSGFTRGTSCRTEVFCVVAEIAGGAGGDKVAQHTSGGWQGHTLGATGSGLSAVSCASTSMCLAGSFSPRVYQYTGSGWTSSWQPPTAGYGVSAISCPTNMRCALTLL
jgi:hypothetical protein